MPRDSNGNYTLPAGNPVVSNTLITSSWANNTMGDLSNEMTDSLSRSGKGGFTAPVSIVDKSGSVPGLNFGLEPTSGFKREAAEDLRIQVTATDVLQCIKTGVRVLSGGSFKVPVVEETGQKVMRGVGGTTVCYFYNDTPPTGWTLNEPDTNIRELVIGPSGSSQGGTIGGSIDPTNLTQTLAVTITGNTAGHILGISQMPQGVGVSSLDNPSNFGVGLGSGAYVAGTLSQGWGPGGGGAHTHGAGTLAGSDNVSIAPRYARGLLATLDA